MKSDNLIIIAMMGLAGWLVLKGTQAKTGTTGGGILGGIGGLLTGGTSSSNGLLQHQRNIMDMYNPSASGDGQTYPLADLYAQMQGIPVNTQIDPVAAQGAVWI